MTTEVVVLATTLRVVCRLVVPRATTLRVLLTLRDTTLRVVVLLPVARDGVSAVVRTRNPEFAREARDVAFARGDAVFTAVGVITGAIGSANTARIDKNVEQTKNAPANKNAVLNAFLAKLATSCLFIKRSPAD